MRALSVGMFIGAIIAICTGFYKILAYENPEGYGDIVNAYVGSDAANIAINASYATAYFVLFGALLIAGLLIEMMIMYMKKNTPTIEANGLPIFDNKEITEELMMPIDANEIK